MTVKCTGSEWNAFYHDPEFWPEGAWWDDAEITVNGVLIDENHSPNVDDINDDDLVKITNGVVYLHEDDTDGPSLEAHFKRWRKQQNTASFVVEVPKTQEALLIALIVNAGGKVKR